ncbi:hypothetical protein TNCV_1265181 [Trichonephila clavipes]|nr:hypothetical protein TNCV_1265181 [Trichonephila clavipes]
MACDTKDCGFQMLNDDEIANSLQEESDPGDDETDKDGDNNENSKGSSNADTFSELETAIEWYEQQSGCCPTQLLLLQRIRDLAVKKRRCTMRKSGKEGDQEQGGWIKWLKNFGVNRWKNIASNKCTRSKPAIISLRPTKPL